VYRFDPRRMRLGEAPLQLDATAGKASVLEYMRGESRFRMIEKQDPVRFRRLAESAEREAVARVSLYQQLSKLTLPSPAARPDTGGNGADAAAAGPAATTPVKQEA
jgi:pyruvate-ferredoxin/flavodoxin oxidoreductase